MSKRPAWAIEIKTIMLKFGITNRQIADAIGKGEQWVSNILTGYAANEQMKKEICNYIYVITNSQKVS
jgi:transcriptional regulator with XRE-family HTH domain